MKNHIPWIRYGTSIRPVGDRILLLKLVVIVFPARDDVVRLVEFPGPSHFSGYPVMVLISSYKG